MKFSSSIAVALLLTSTQGVKLQQNDEQQHPLTAVLQATMANAGSSKEPIVINPALWSPQPAPAPAPAPAPVASCPNSGGDKKDKKAEKGAKAARKAEKAVAEKLEKLEKKM